jgi:hypothetical protein
VIKTPMAAFLQVEDDVLDIGYCDGIDTREGFVQQNKTAGKSPARV